MRNTAGDSWQGLAYDPITYETDVRQSTDPLRYNLDPVYANPCGQLCRPDDIGYIGKVGVSIDKKNSLIDTESDLMLLNYRASRAPQYKYIPSLTNSSDKTGYPGPVAGGIQSEVMDQDKYRDTSDKWNFPKCGKLRSEYTRVSYPLCDLKEIGVNRFQPICLDPQDRSRWEHPSEIGINYRMVVKDNWRPCVPRMIDQTLALPKAQADSYKRGTGITTTKPVKTVIGGGSGIIDGLPMNKVNLSYCVANDTTYGHKFQCNQRY